MITNIGNLGISVDAVSAYVEMSLQRFAERMPDGCFFDQNGDAYYCDGIVLTAIGDVCPVFHKTGDYWRLCPLTFETIDKYGCCYTNHYNPYLSNKVYSAIMMGGGRSLEESVKAYNDGYIGLINHGINQTQFTIIGWHEF